jgi:hypothetical protein
MGGGGEESTYNEIQYGESMRESMEAQIDLGDDLFRAESSQSTGQPAWMRLNQDMLADQVLGSNMARRYEGRHDEDDTIGATEIIGGDSTRYTQFFNQNGDISFRRIGEDGMGIHGGAAKVEQDILERAQTQQLQTALGLSKRYGGDLTESIRNQGDVQGALDRSKKLTEQSAVNDEFNLDPQSLSSGTSKVSDMYAPSVRYRNGVPIGLNENLIESPDGVSGVTVDKVSNELNPTMANRYNVGAQTIQSKEIGNMLYRDEMLSQAGEELMAGGDLTAQERRNVQQDARVAATARGRARGYGSVVDEVNMLDQNRRQRQADRRQFASQTLSQEADILSRNIDSSFRTDQSNQQADLQGKLANQGNYTQVELANQQAGITAGQAGNQMALANQQAQLQASQANQASALQTQAQDLQAQQLNQAQKDTYLARDLEAKKADRDAMLQAQQIEEQMRLQALSMDRAAANQYVGLEQATSADPFLAVTGRGSGASVPSGSSVYGAGLSAGGGGPALYNPAQGAEWMANQNASMNNFNANIYAANAQKQAGMFGGAMSALGGLGGAAILKGCWVAREVYGVHNPKWMVFRHWMLFLSPFWFRAIYLRFGERFANYISNKPTLKKKIRAWMDSKVLEVV